MNRIQSTFSGLSQRNEKALVGFVTAGDPDVHASLALIQSMCENGLDILELGVPFSDPTADGPVIQRSSARALSHGVSLRTVMEMTREIRRFTDIPIVLFSYYNPILAYGVDSFYRNARNAGADGVLIVDLPLEESAEMTDHPLSPDLPLIRLVAPTTPVERMKAIASASVGFLYLVSKTGITGSEGLDTGEVAKNVARIRSVTDIPVCVGFGVRTADDVAQIASVADGVVIGSAFERLIESHPKSPDLSAVMGGQTAEYKRATVRA
jgi:tryptophan synthase alpha chain